MTIQILSDLHLESPKAYDVFDIEPTAPHLALLGDIGNVAAHRHEFFGFLARQLRQFRTVMLVPGNHEAYQSSWAETLEMLRAFERDWNASRDASLVEDGGGGEGGTGRFVLLDRGVVRPLPGGGTAAVVLGCSLFSHVPAESREAVGIGLNDFFQTDGWDVDAHNAAHARDLAWLNEQVAEIEREREGPGAEIVILSHWSPTVDARAVDPRHAGSRISSAFATDLSREKCFTSGRVKAWAFGHTHYNCDFLVGRERGAGPLRLMANQRGYYFAQSDGFEPGKTVEI